MLVWPYNLQRKQMFCIYIHITMCTSERYVRAGHQDRAASIYWSSALSKKKEKYTLANNDLCKSSPVKAFPQGSRNAPEFRPDSHTLDGK